MAVQKVIMEVNESVHNDEVLADRIRLVTLKSDKVDEFSDFLTCVCDNTKPDQANPNSIPFCQKCSVELVIDVCNDGSEDILNVTIADLKSSKRNLPQRMTVSPVVSTEHKIPAILTKLGNGQRLKLTAIARKGIAREDPTWMSVCPAAYTFKMDVTVDPVELKKLDSKQKEIVFNSCPAKVFDIEMTVVNDAACYNCLNCQIKSTVLGAPDLVAIKQRPEHFEFTVEATGSLTPERIIRRAIEIVKTKPDSLLLLLDEK